MTYKIIRTIPVERHSEGVKDARADYAANLLLVDT